MPNNIPVHDYIPVHEYFLFMSWHLGVSIQSLILWWWTFMQILCGHMFSILFSAVLGMESLDTLEKLLDSFLQWLYGFIFTPAMQKISMSLIFQNTYYLFYCVCVWIALIPLPVLSLHSCSPMPTVMTMPLYPHWIVLLGIIVYETQA